MALRLVNQTPTSEPLKPGGLVQFSIKSDSSKPVLGSLMAKFGISRLLHGSKLPDLDEHLKKYGEVTYSSPWGVTPYSGECVRSLSSGRIIITKQTNDTADQGVYSYKVGVSPGMSSLAYLKTRKHAWSTGGRPWVSLDAVAGLLFGLKSGLHRTSCDIFLRDDGADGTIVVAGPISGDARSHEVEYPFAWKPVPDNGSIELWVHLNADLDAPSFEVWGSIDRGEVSLVASIPTALLATDSASITNDVTIYFGNGGFAGDVIDIEDWGMYPDFRDIIRFSDALPHSSILVAPDAPTIYRASTGKLPSETAPARWNSFGEPHASFGFDPGRKLTPQSVILDKYQEVGEARVAYTGRAGFEREEPRLGARSSGFMVESFMSGFAKNVEVESFGAGIAVNDGIYSYRALLYKAATRNAVTIQTAGDATLLEAQRDPGTNIDWEVMRLLRMAVDRDRQTIKLWVDDELVLEDSLGKNFPKTRKTSVEFGHVLDATTQGQVNVGFVNYLTQYRAYEATDGVGPDEAVPAFTERKMGSGSTVAEGGVLKINKEDVSSAGTHRNYFLALPIDLSTGMMVDVRGRLPIFWDQKGTPMAAAAYTGVGLFIHLGSKVFKFGFYNCGVHGKYIGVLPGSGTVKDIIDQSTLGRQFSAPVDWTKMETYRVVVRAYDRIEIWAGKTTNKPAITIPWRNDTDGFDLPTEALGQASGISFGHEKSLAASHSEWEFLRWGTSSGYDVAVSQGYPNGVREDQYGGKSVLLMDMDEDT